MRVRTFIVTVKVEVLGDGYTDLEALDVATELLLNSNFTVVETRQATPEEIEA